MFLHDQTNNYASLTIGNRSSKRGSVSKHPFVLKKFEQANLSLASNSNLIVNLPSQKVISLWFLIFQFFTRDHQLISQSLKLNF